MKEWSHYKKQEYRQAIDEFDAAIQLRGMLPNAHNDRGGAYEALGNFQAAAHDYENAAALGSAFAMTNLGRMYETGRGVPKDYSEARRWYEKGAQGGDALAMNNLGALYGRGQGCDVVALKVEDVAQNGHAVERATARQKKTRQTVRFRAIHAA